MMMTSKRNRGGGSFRDIRDRHLPDFEWPESPRDPPKAPAQSKPIKRAWKREGILHYAVDDTD
jgi:hypothetical protein